MCGMYVKAARDRHGRGARGPLVPRETPRWRTRGDRFDILVLDIYTDLISRFKDEMAHVDLAVDLIPRMSIHSHVDHYGDDVVTHGPVVLGRLIPAGIDREGRPTRPRIVLFRRPIELRSQDRKALASLIRYVEVKLIAQYLNIPPEIVDSKNYGR